MNDMATTKPTMPGAAWWQALRARIALWWERRRKARAERSPFERSSRDRRTGSGDAQLPSAVVDIPFQVTFDVIWCRRSRKASWGQEFALAVETLTRAAEPIAAMISPLDPERLERRLKIELVNPTQALDTDLWTLADDVTVSLHAADLRDAKALAEVQRARTRRIIEREAELADIKHLREQVFVDVGQATLWWLRQQDYEVERVRDQGPTLEQLVKLAQGYADEHWADDWINGALVDIPATDMAARHQAIIDAYEALKASARDIDALEVLRRAQLRVPSLIAVVDSHDRRLAAEEESAA